MGRFVTICMAVLMLAATPVAVPLERTSPGRGNVQAEHKATERGTQSAPLVVQIDQSDGHEAIATKAKDEGHWYASPDWWVAGFTGALFVVTAGLWGATWLLWSSTNKAVKDASKGLKVAEETLEHSRESSERQLRAYVNFVFPSPNVTVTDLSCVSLTVVMENYGQTPALELVTDGRIDIFDHPPPSPFPYTFSSLGRNGEEASRFNLHPRLTSPWYTTVVARRPFTKKEWDEAMIEKTKRLYLFGETRYRDVFGKNHFVRFRMSTGGDGRSTAFTFCSEGNETDD